MDLPARKAQLRARMAERRRALEPAEARRAAEAVAARVGGLRAFRQARTVAVYAALPDELPSRPLFEAVRAAGKRAALPRVAGDRLEFAAVDAWEELVPGRYGVAEPRPDAVAEAPGELVIVPGVAFDRAGHRLGRGKGFYDRTFAPGGPAGVLVGVGYAFQVLDEVPHGPGDRRMDVVVTEAGAWPADEGGKDR